MNNPARILIPGRVKICNITMKSGNRNYLSSALLWLLFAGIGLFHCSVQQGLKRQKRISEFPVILRTIPLTGRLIEQETRNPVADAKLFISGTSITTSTDTFGVFHFENIPFGMHRMMIFLSGYYPVVRSIGVSPEYQDSVIIAVPGASFIRQDTCRTDQAKIHMLEIQVNELRKALSGCSEEIALFRDYLIGHQPECQIMNPEVIEYKRENNNRGFFISYTMREPLILENRFLGYSMTVFFQKAIFKEFRYIYQINYSASIQFMEMETADQKQMNEWKKERQHVYEGSFRHFLSALATRQIEQEGFVLYRPPHVNPQGKPLLGYGTRQPEWTLIYDPYQFVRQLARNRYELDFEGIIRVSYIFKGLGDKAERTWGLTGKGQSSTIQLINGPIRFNRYGHLLSLNTPHFTEYWKTVQVSEMLPLFYRPD